MAIAATNAVITEFEVVSNDTNTAALVRLKIKANTSAGTIEIPVTLDADIDGDIDLSTGAVFADIQTQFADRGYTLSAL